MANIDVNSIFQALKSQVISLAAGAFSNYKQQATEDMNNFLNASEENLKKWTLMLADNSLSQDDFEDLVKGQANNLKLEVLEQTGIAEIEMDKLKSAIIDLVLNTLIKSIS